MSSDLPTRLCAAEKSFKKACQQIILLNQCLSELSTRYEKEKQENYGSLRYSLKLRMAVTEGVRNMYYEYASVKADEISMLRSRIILGNRVNFLDEDHGENNDTGSQNDMNVGGANVDEEEDREGQRVDVEQAAEDVLFRL